jgi:hypothetical protein
MKKVRVLTSGENVYVRDANDKVILQFWAPRDSITPGKYEYHLDTDDPGRIDLVLINVKSKRKYEL